MINKFRDIVVHRITQSDYIAPLCCVLNKMDVYPEGFICGEHLGEMYETFENQESYFKHWDLTTWLSDPFNKLGEPCPTSAASSIPPINASPVSSPSATSITGQKKDTSSGK